jgi:hypothetical protein
MRSFRSHLAVVLLLCFARVLLPDAWVLTLHAHEHTSELEPARTKGAKAMLTAKHQHCQTDHFCALHFEAAPALQFGLVPAYGQTQAAWLASVGVGKPLPTQPLRGPPARA